MPKAYWTCAYRFIPDHQQREIYSELAIAAVKAAGGRFLARGGRMRANEDAVPERTVIVEFDSFEQAITAIRWRTLCEGSGGTTAWHSADHRMVEGLE